MITNVIVRSTSGYILARYLISRAVKKQLCGYRQVLKSASKEREKRRCFWWWRRRFLGCFHLGTNQFHGVEASSLLLHQKFSTFAQAACCCSCWSYSCSLPFVIRRRVFTRKTDGLVFRESQNTSFWSDYNLRYKSEEKTLESNCNHKEMNVIGGKKPGSFDRVVLLNQPLLWPYNFYLSY